MDLFTIMDAVDRNTSTQLYSLIVFKTRILGWIRRVSVEDGTLVIKCGVNLFIGYFSRQD